MVVKKIIKIFYDDEGNTLNVWFDNPEKEVICEEIDDETVIRKDKLGRVIGFEKLNFISAKILKKRPQVEVVIA